MPKTSTFFIHSCCFYSVPSSPLLLKGAPDTARILCAPRHSTDTVSEFHVETSQATVRKGLAQGPHMAARAGFEPTTLRTKGVESTNESSRPTMPKTSTFIDVITVRNDRFVINSRSECVSIRPHSRL